jgi:sugar/nucleoside kinase (ribokinase family)
LVAVGDRQIRGQRFIFGILPVTFIDTTGAGDLYASGFLYGLANGYDLEKCGKIGAILAGKMIEVIGPKIDEEGWLVVRRMIKDV